MTLTEIDNAKKHNPSRYYKFFFYIQARIRKEQKEIDKMKNKSQGGSGESDTFTMKPRKVEE